MTPTPTWSDFLAFLVVCMWAGAVWGLAETAQAPARAVVAVSP